MPSDKTGPGRSSPSAGVPWLSWALLLGCGFIVLGPLSPTWTINPNYSFGWWIPVVCLVLFAERWPLRPRSNGAPSSRIWLVPQLALWGVLFLAFRLAAEADPDWRPGLWVLLTLYVAILLTWLWLAGGLFWVRHFAFPIGFLFLCVPWPFEIEYPLVQGLMRWNAIIVSDSLHVIGIFADPAGNIIRLKNCQLGVEEACSGILSLQASLVMGCLLGDIYRLSIPRRIYLALGSMTLALIGNYLRTLFLALMAFYNGPDAVPEWHDTAGYSILVFTALGSWLIALCLGDGKTPPAPTAVEPSLDREPRQTPNALRFAAAIFGLALLAEGITQAWFSWKESSLNRHPEWAIQFPASKVSFKDLMLSDVTLEALRCDDFKVGQWEDTHGWRWTAYWLRYDPKPYTKTVLGWHNPDKCLPSVGLTKDQDYPDFAATANGLDFYTHPKKFMFNDAPVYVFWLVYPLSGNLPEENYSATGLSFATKFWSHLQDVRNGNRGVGVETLEVILIGPQDYDTAKAAYLNALKEIAVPKPRL
jgi:exosortase